MKGILCTWSKLNRFNIINNNIRYSSKISSSVKNISSDDHDNNEIELDKKSGAEYNIATRIERRKPQIEPVCKFIFASEFNGELLAFPEILNKEELDDLDSVLATVKRDGEQSGGVLWGAPCDKLLGGTAANLTERCRILEDAPTSLSLKVRDHWFGLDLVLKSDMPPDKKNNILIPLISGEKKTRVMIREQLSSDPKSENLQTTIVRNVENRCYVSGEKVIEQDQSLDISKDQLIVAASAGCFNFRMIMLNDDNSDIQVKGNKVSFHEALGTILTEPRAVESEEKKFLQVEQAMKAPLANFRLGSAAIALRLIRDAVSLTLEKVKGKYMNGRPIGELPLFQDTIVKALDALYRAESMVYMTCGLADGYELPDIELEATLTKIVALNEAVTSLCGLNDTLCNFKLCDDFIPQYLDALRLLHRDEILDMLYVYGGLLGVQHTGIFLQNAIKKARNPLSFPGFNLKKNLDNLLDLNKEPKLTLRLFENLHHTLQHSADQTEHCVLIMKNHVINICMKYAKEVPNAHREITRLCMAAGEIYAMISCLSRASRSYCIGLANSEKEVVQAMTICEFGKERVKQLLAGVEDAPNITDGSIEHLALANIKNRAPLAEHCLNRVYY